MQKQSSKDSKTTELSTKFSAKKDWMSLAKKWSTVFSKKHEKDSVEGFEKWLSR